MIVTASLANGVVRVSHGLSECAQLIDEVLEIEHVDWETTLSVGDVAFYQSKDAGPFPNHQFRVSVRPSADLAACHYTDHEDAEMPTAISWNPEGLPHSVDLVFNGTTGSVFPREAAIPLIDARRALLEWVQSRQRPTCIRWRSYDMY